MNMPKRRAPRSNPFPIQPTLMRYYRFPPISSSENDRIIVDFQLPIADCRRCNSIKGGVSPGSGFLRELPPVARRPPNDLPISDCQLAIGNLKSAVVHG